MHFYSIIMMLLLKEVNCLPNKIDKNMPIPLYYQLKQLIINNINDGIYKENEAIPTEFEFINDYKLSRTTVRQALNELVNEGYLFRRKGVGTYVSSTTVLKIAQSTNFPLYHISSMIEEAGYVSSVKLLQLEADKASLEVANALQIPVGEAIWVMDRVRMADENPVSFSRTFFSRKLIENFDEVVDEASQSFHSFLDKNGHQITAIKHYLIPGITDETTSDILKIPINNPMMILKDICYSNEDVPIEYSISASNETFIEFTSTSIRKPTT